VMFQVAARVAAAGVHTTRPAEAGLVAVANSVAGMECSLQPDRSTPSVAYKPENVPLPLPLHPCRATNSPWPWPLSHSHPCERQHPCRLAQDYLRDAVLEVPDAIQQVTEGGGLVLEPLWTL
jgi:hypothetical protein